MLDLLRNGQSTCTDFGRLGRDTLISVVGSDGGGRLHGTGRGRLGVIEPGLAKSFPVAESRLGDLATRASPGL